MHPTLLLTALAEDVAILRNAYLTHRDDADTLARRWRDIMGVNSWIILRDVMSGEILEDWMDGAAPWSTLIDKDAHA